MATTRKGRSRTAKSGPTGSETVEATAPGDGSGDAPEATEVPPRRVYRIVLREGATCVVADRTFVRGRPVEITDVRLYERLRGNGRFAVDVLKGAK